MLQNKAIEIKYLQVTLIDVFNQTLVHKNAWKMVVNMIGKILQSMAREKIVFGREKVAMSPELLQNWLWHVTTIWFKIKKIITWPIFVPK